MAAADTYESQLALAIALSKETAIAQTTADDDFAEVISRSKQTNIAQATDFKMLAEAIKASEKTTVVQSILDKDLTEAIKRSLQQPKATSPPEMKRDVQPRMKFTPYYWVENVIDCAERNLKEIDYSHSRVNGVEILRATGPKVNIRSDRDDVFVLGIQAYKLDKFTPMNDFDAYTKAKLSAKIGVLLLNEREKLLLYNGPCRVTEMEAWYCNKQNQYFLLK